jgi:hypothetical protein
MDLVRTAVENAGLVEAHRGTATGLLRRRSDGVDVESVGAAAGERSVVVL